MGADESLGGWWLGGEGYWWGYHSLGLPFIYCFPTKKENPGKLNICRPSAWIKASLMYEKLLWLERANSLQYFVPVEIWHKTRDIMWAGKKNFITVFDMLV